MRLKRLDLEETSAEASGGISDAQVIVSGRMGLQKAENSNLLRQLGCVVAGSHAIVEQGWLARPQQVGQSGTTVSPQLYLAAGISGAILHRVGMSSAKVVIAINTDAEAPILQVADLAVVGAATRILPVLGDLIEAERSRKRVQNLPGARL